MSINCMNHFHCSYLIHLIIFHCFIPGLHGEVYITGVNPTQGSLAGGTRVVIRGSGFSSNTNSVGNAVYIGSQYFCDPIPLHSTINQIICKTRSALAGYYSNPPTLWTLPQNITVVVDGSQNSSCSPSQGQTCTFQFTTSWYFPIISMNFNILI